ncbi:MAG: hypothetical protein ABFR32_12140 [Bacteroidota bacterium]
MKQFPKLVRLFFLLILLNSCAQEKKGYSQEIKNSITPILLTLNNSLEIFEETNQTYSKIINEKITILNQKNDEQPKKYGLLKEQSDKLANSVNGLNSYLDSLILESEKNHFDTYNYTMMTDTVFFSNILYKKNNTLSERGQRLEEKIDQFFKINNEILESYSREAKAYNNMKFNTSHPFTNYEGEQINYMDYKLTDRTVIGTLLYLKKLQLEIKTLQMIFMNSIIR